VRSYDAWLVIAILSACHVTGCAVGPDYRRPTAAGDATVPAQFANSSTPGVGEGSVDGAFWASFGDPTLSALVTDALAKNYDLKSALASLSASRAATRLTRYNQIPTVTSSAGVSRGLESARELPLFPRAERQGTAFDVGFDASWELDFFGRVRREVEAARTTEQAIEASVHDVQISVAAEVARNYFVLRGLQEQLAVAERNTKNQQNTLAITQQRLAAGRGNELDTSRAETQLQNTLASIPPLESAVSTTIYRLSGLTGRQPDTLTPLLRNTQPLPALPALTAIGTPEELLRRRPDVRMAERQLAAATARIGIAIGDLFPKVTFLGSIGYDAAMISALGGRDSQVYSFGPSISWAAFDLGRVRSRITIARANADGALAAYQSVVLAALEETEGSLVTYGRAQSRRATLELAASASARAAALANQRFQGGLTDFLNVLEAERDALATQDALAQSRAQAATSLVAVYKALGGGWTAL
jgi:multidrug efflux system outer membrane protein